jgi:hypothetical protein
MVQTVAAFENGVVDSNGNNNNDDQRGRKAIRASRVLTLPEQLCIEQWNYGCITVREQMANITNNTSWRTLHGPFRFLISISHYLAVTLLTEAIGLAACTVLYESSDVWTKGSHGLSTGIRKLQQPATAGFVEDWRMSDGRESSYCANGPGLQFHRNWTKAILVNFASSSGHLFATGVSSTTRRQVRMGR